MMKDTIFALATLFGKSGVAVIRISGEKAKEAARDLGIIKKFIPNQATFSKIKHPVSKEILDEGIVLFFEGPKSFTGEDILELHLHGSIAVIKDTISALSELNYLRIAEPGEFAKRAFLNGKFDLTQADAIALLIDAETSMQRKVALNQLGGVLENLYEGWRSKIIKIIAQVEALIDFPEDDIPHDLLSTVFAAIDLLAVEIESHLTESNKSESIFLGIEVAIIGIPNAGKSSLLNTITNRDIAIVSNIAGTTRDVVEAKIEIDGFLVNFSDTAGIRDTSDVVELEGVRRAYARLENADIALFVVDASNFDDSSVVLNLVNLYKETIIILNKIDLFSKDQVLQNIVNVVERLEQSKANITFAVEGSAQEVIFIGNADIIPFSSFSKQGKEQLLKRLKEKISRNYTTSSNPIITKERYRINLKKSVGYLKSISKEESLEVFSEKLRSAMHYIGIITGKIDIEEILDEVFSSFCIGK